MSDSPSLERLAALTGVLAIVLFVAGVVMGGTPPDPSASVDEITAHLADNGGRLRAAQYLTGLALAAFLWFTGTLAAHLRRSGAAGRLPRIVLAAAAALAGAFLIQSALVVTATYEPSGESAAVSAGFFRLALEIAPHTSFLVGTLVGAVGLAILRHDALPRPLGWFCLVFASYEVVEGASVLNRDGALAPGGIVNDLGPVFLVVWGLWTSIALHRRIGARGARAAAGEPGTA